MLLAFTGLSLLVESLPGVDADYQRLGFDPAAVCLGKACHRILSWRRLQQGFEGMVGVKIRQYVLLIIVGNAVTRQQT